MATNKREVYRCPHCGNIVEVLGQAGGTLVCCGSPMKLLKENTQEAAVEKHIPVIEKIDGGYKVIVGSVEHPMQPEHYIRWIELIETDNDLSQIKFLNPGDKPVAIFKSDSKSVYAREYCNLHGQWKSELM